MKNKTINIVWFKRDLRTTDHKPLYEASQTKLPTLPLFIVEPEYWARSYSSTRHWYFLRDCLLDLNSACSKLGQPLIVQTGEAITIFKELKTIFNIETIHAHEETGDDWTYNRDIRVRKWCCENGIKFIESSNNGVVRGLKNRDLWAKIRNERVYGQIIPEPVKLKPICVEYEKKIPERDDPLFGRHFGGKIQIGGRKEALSLLQSFKNDRGKDYLFNISSPLKSEVSCSRLSTHLAWGTISVKELLRWLPKSSSGALTSQTSLNGRNLAAFKSRLAWRCHFIQKLEDNPQIEFKCMHKMFEGMREPVFNPTFFKAWTEGTTGYPFIDACMRSLIENGWITFRSRALLVSFASYNLWLDWRKTGEYLAQLFTDFEPGIHFSQLQMQSGVTGINAIRIYNPIKQSFDQDKDGAFIKKWLPALKKVPKEFIHEPWLMDSEMQVKINCIIGKNYPLPIVEFKSSFKIAKDRIKQIRQTNSFRTVSDQVFKELGSRKKKAKRSKRKSISYQLSFDI